MVKFALSIAAAPLALVAMAASANATPLARVGVGQVYNNVAACAAATGTYAPSEAAQAYARAHPAAGTPVYGADATGTVCVLMHTSVPGMAEDGRQQGDHWVRVPKRFVYRATNGGMIYYRLCNNPILQVQEEVAVRTSEGPCPDCAQLQPARVASVSYTEEAQVSYEAPRVAYQGAPVSFSLPGQSIGQGLFPQSVAVAVSNVNYTSTTNHFTIPGAANPNPPFGVGTQPPAPSGNGFGVDTQPPIPAPAPTNPTQIPNPFAVGTSGGIQPGFPSNGVSNGGVPAGFPSNGSSSNGVIGQGFPTNGTSGSGAIVDGNTGLASGIGYANVFSGGIPAGFQSSGTAPTPGFNIIGNGVPAGIPNGFATNGTTTTTTTTTTVPTPGFTIGTNQ